MSGSYDDGRPRWPEREFERDYERERNRYLERDRYPESTPPPVPEPPPPPEPEPEPEAEPEPEPEPERVPQPPQRAPEVEAQLPSPPTEASPPSTQFADWDLRRDGDRRRPTTAEQAVPWLIGLLLALTGIVVVLLALIFIGPEGVPLLPSPTATASPSVRPTPVASATPVPTASPTPIPPPVFGALEMTFLGRATPSAPIHLLRRDFSTTTDAVVIAEDPSGVEDYAWAPDGREGVAIISRNAVALVPGQPARPLTDAVDAIVFGDDSTTLYALRTTGEGATDRAELLTIDFATGATKVVTTITYPHTTIVKDAALKAAQFADDGGIVRLNVTTDGFVVAWIQGAPAAYRIDPADGSFTQVDHQPVMWSPDQRTRIDATEKSGTTTITLFDQAGIGVSAIAVKGLVSHIRWAATNNEIVYTLGRLVGGGVRQDLYVWDLVNGKAPSPLTSNGASFGAEWLGVLQSWKP